MKQSTGKGSNKDLVRISFLVEYYIFSIAQNQFIRNLKVKWL